MPEPFVEIDASDLIRYMDRVKKVKPDFRDLQDVIEVAAQHAENYPPAPPASTYRRTGFLGRSFYPRATKDEFALMTVADYAKYVIGAYQVRIHRMTGWYNVVERIDEIVREAADKIAARIMRQLD